MKKKYFYLFFCLVIFSIKISRADSYYNWAKRFGDAGAKVDEGHCIVSDSLGNVYLAGLFKGTVDFDPGQGVFNLSAGGTNENIFFAKFNANGNFLWARQLGDANSSRGLTIQVDDTGNVYLLANFEVSTSLDFDPGTGVAALNGQGNKTIAFAKYTTNGAYVWAKSISGNSDCYAEALRVKPDGNIYLSGKFRFTADFDPSASSANLTSTGSSNGFFAKYDNQGNYSWVKQLSGGTVEPSQMELDNSGNIYLTGFYRTTCDFDPDGLGQFTRSNDGNADFFVACYTENGTFSWAIALDGINEDFGNSIAVDLNHNVYVAGTFIDSLETDPSPVDNYLVSSSTGVSDNFVAKYSSSGAAVWAFRLGNALTDYCNSIAVNKNGTLFID